MERQIELIVVHCSDSPDERDIGFKEINIWHRERFSGVMFGGVRVYCGYHYIVRKSGVIEVGRPEGVAGAHVKGHNQRSIGVCWAGRMILDPRQRAALIGLLRDLCNRYGLLSMQVVGHRELDPKKTCPNADMNLIRSEIGPSAGRLP